MSAFDLDAARAARRRRPSADLERDALRDDGVSVLDTRPTLEVGARLDALVDAATAALPADPDVYHRNGHLQRVVRVDPDTATDEIPAGTPQIRPVQLATLRYHLARVARWIKTPARGPVRDVAPPDVVVAAVHERAEWPSLPILNGVVETPIVRPDGVIVTDAGHDEKTGVLYAPTIALPPLPLAPTHDAAVAALAQLREPFADFPFSSESARMVPVAAVLTLLARDAIRGPTPAVILDATTRGSGKSRCADVIATIATGRAAPRKCYPEDEVEVEKVISSYAMFGASVLCLDNIATTFGGATLELILTTGLDGRYEARILGRSEIASNPWRALVIGTGNNVQLAADTTRRVILARMEPDCERPEDRTDFAHPDLLAWVLAERPRLVVAALTLLRAWYQAGQPRVLGIMASFEAWSAVVPQAIAWAGGANVLDCRVLTTEADSDASALAALLDGLDRLGLVDRPWRSREVIDALYADQRARDRGDLEPDGHDALRDAIEAMVRGRPGIDPDPTRLGVALRRHVGRIVGGRRLMSVAMPGHASGWRVERVAR